MIFGRQPKESTDDLANRLQQEGHIDQLEKELQRYNPRRLSEENKASYYHLWGITAFRRGDRAAAFERFKEGHEQCPNSADILFSLGQEHEARREIDQMYTCFDACIFPKVSSAYTLAAARYAYLWGGAEQGNKYLAPIAEAYFQLGIADDHFVYVRGLPFFGQTWSYLVTFAWMSGSYTETDDLLERSRSELSEYDFESLATFYECHKASDYAALTDKLADDLRNPDPHFPKGYQRTQLATLPAIQANDISSAISQLENIELAENDFPWLADIALAHKARLYWKAGMEDAEADERSHFMARQPMLFEPDHAYAFALLDYQESLRPAYQAVGTI